MKNFTVINLLTSSAHLLPLPCLLTLLCLNNYSLVIYITRGCNLNYYFK